MISTTFSPSWKRSNKRPTVNEWAAPDEKVGMSVSSHNDGGAWDPKRVLTEENVQDTLDFLQDSQNVTPELMLADVADLSYLNALPDEIGRR
jgi:hypothetical protein